jgi:hypothetical protein
LIKIDNLPSLIDSVTLVSIVDNNSLTLFIFTTRYIKDLVVRWIVEVFILVIENLEPSRISAPDLHVLGSSSALDIP